MNMVSGEFSNVRDVPVKVTLENGLVCFDGVPEPMTGRLEQLKVDANGLWHPEGGLDAEGFYYSRFTNIDGTEAYIDYVMEYHEGRKNGLGLVVCEDGSLANVEFYMDGQCKWIYRF